MFPSEPVKAACLAEGFDLVGVCAAGAPETLGFYEEWLGRGFHGEMGYLAESVALRGDLESVLPGVRTVVMVGLNYYQEVGGDSEPVVGGPPPGPLLESSLRSGHKEGELPSDSSESSFSKAEAPPGPLIGLSPNKGGKPRIARYALGRDYHRVIRGKLRRVGAALGAEWGGEWRAATDSAPILEREFAHRAGLGWFGKNTMLINSKRGSWFLIGTLLTTVEIEPDERAEGGCGTCRACIDACPTGAIVQAGGRWQVDARRCISYLTIEKRGAFSAAEEAMVGDWTFGCDVCQEVCPFNQPRESQPLRAAVTTEPDFLDRREWPGLERLRVIPEEEWDELTRGSAVRRAGVEGIRRNARANLGNRGD